MRLHLVLLALSSLISCALVRDDPQTLLGRGRYVEASEMLASEEAAARSYSKPERARYALFRGLAHLALGDAIATDRWLGEAKSLYDADPSCLSPDDAGRLLDAWRSLGRGV